RHITDRNACNVLDLDRQAAGLGQDNVFDVLYVITVRYVICAAAIDQADAADVDRLLTDGDFPAADIDVAVPKRADQLRHRDVVGLELLQVGIDIELFGGAAPGIDLRHSRNGEQAARHHVVLQRAQVSQPEVRRPDDLVAIDLADQARRLDGRNEI